MNNEEKAGVISGRILGCRDGKTQEIFNACMEMAEWKDEQYSAEKKRNIEEMAVDINYLQCWYQDSIDETTPPVWTDAHIDEIFKDFYLIPKS